MSTSWNEPRERDVALADDASLHVIEAGDPDAPPFLLLHGYPQSAAEWLGVMSAAAGTARTIAVDLPGIGGSPPAAGGGSKVAIADLVHGLIETLEHHRHDPRRPRRRRHGRLCLPAPFTPPSSASPSWKP